MEHAWKSRATQLAFALTNRIASILVPLGFSFGDFTAAAKSAFVEAATAQIRRGGKRPSTAKIAILTGLTRAEVSRIRSGRHAPSKATTDQRTERVMHGWFTDAKYVDERGAPRVLPVKGHASFDELVRRHSGDVPRKAVLEELIAGGMAALTENDMVRALRRHRVAPPPSALDLDSLSRDLEIVFSSVGAAQDSDAPKSRRVTVQFSTPIPKGVRRTVSIRTERFLEALADYLHNEASSPVPEGSRTNSISFSVLVAQGEDVEAEKNERRVRHGK